MVVDMGVEVWSTGVTWHGVWWASQMVPRNPDIPVNYLARQVELCHQHDIYVLALEQLSEAENQDIAGEMAQWALHPIQDGRSIPPDKRWLSYTSPYREWQGRYMAEYVRVADVDGFWFDATPFANRGPWPWAAGDAGPFGQETYRKETGRPVPEKVDWQSQAFREWVQWRYDKTIEFFTYVTEQAAREKPYVAALMNYYSRPELNWEVAHPLRRLDGPWHPAIEGESSLLDRVGRALTPRCEMWMWAQWYVPEIAHGVAPYSDPDRAIAQGLRALAHGVVPCYGGQDVDIALWKDSFKTLYTELKARRDYFQGDTVKYAALLISQQTRDYRRDPGNLWRSVEGVNDLHNAAHLLTDVIFDDSLTAEGLAPYPVVFLSNVACLSEAQCEVLRGYVRDGGTLVATMETSLYDEWGNKRANFGLADLFQADYQQTDGSATQILVPQTPELKQHFDRFVCFVGPATRVRRAATGSAQALFTRSPRTTINGLTLASETYDSEEPAILCHRFGRGTVYYLAAEVGQAYMNHRLPQVVEMVSHLERSAAVPPVEFEAPVVLETTALWQSEKRMIVHLANCSALNVSTGRMTPLAEISVTVRKGTIRSARSGLTGKRLRVEGNRIMLPVVRYGEVIVIELTA